MNVLKGSPKLSFSSGPITKNISDKKFVPRIKPLFYVAEDKIRKFTKQKNFRLSMTSVLALLILIGFKLENS